MPTTRAPFADVVDAVRDHTALLLGTTIGYSEQDWAEPTSLSGWTRSHVAAHLAAGARGLSRVISGLHQGNVVRMYQSQSEKHSEIELGALASGLELQIRLDTSASELQQEFGSIEDDQRSVELRAGYRVRASDLPLARLGEVVLHHLDLGNAHATDALNPAIAVALLDFHVARIGQRDDYPPLTLVSEEGFRGSVGRIGETTQVNGPACDLLAWLVRGVESPRIYRSSGSAS